METGELETAFETFKETFRQNDCLLGSMSYILPNHAFRLDFISNISNTTGVVLIVAVENSTSVVFSFDDNRVVDTRTIPFSPPTTRQINEELQIVLNNLKLLIV